MPLQYRVDSLFQPFALGSLMLKNRIVMAPMTRGFSPDGIPGQDVAAYYRRRAEGGVGLIITEGTWIPHPTASDNPRVPNFYGHEALVGWQRVVDEVHAVGGRIMPQLWHVGLVAKIGQTERDSRITFSPSGVWNPSEPPVVAEATEKDIEEVIGAYGAAAANAKALGFDGVEIHAAHGYLIDQFFWQKTNLRTDRYGGSLKARTRFAVEVVQEMRRQVGPEFPIVLRFSQWKIQDYAARLFQSPDELAEFLEILNAAGVSAYHCSTRRFWEPEFAGSPLNLAGWTKKLSGKPSITVGSVGLDGEFLASIREGKDADISQLDKVVDALEKHEFDLVAVGRALLANPDWPNRVRRGEMEQLKAYSMMP